MCFLLQDVSLENIGVRRDSEDKNRQMCYLNSSFGWSSTRSRLTQKLLFCKDLSSDWSLTLRRLSAVQYPPRYRTRWICAGLFGTSASDCVWWIFSFVRFVCSVDTQTHQEKTTSTGLFSIILFVVCQHDDTTTEWISSGSDKVDRWASVEVFIPLLFKHLRSQSWIFNLFLFPSDSLNTRLFGILRPRNSFLNVDGVIN